MEKRYSLVLEQSEAKQPNGKSIHWLSDEEYSKAVGQLQRQAAGIFDFLKVDNKLPIRYMYGLGDLVPGAIEEIVKLCEDFGLRVRGVDKPLALDIIRRKSGHHID